MRRVVSLFLVAGLLLATASAVADSGRGRGPAAVGAFQVHAETRAATGEHVSFSYSEAGIDDYRAANRTLFDIRVTGAPGGEREDHEDEDEEDDEDGAREGASVDGARLRVRMANFTFIAHDNPTGASKLESDGVAVVTFLDGVVLARDNGERVRFSYGDVTGTLRGDDLQIVGRNVTAREEVLILLEKPRGSFDVYHRDIGRAIGKGHVGAETTLNLGERDDVREDTVSYANVTMTTVKAERGNITVLIDGHGIEGRVIVLNVDGRVLGAEKAENLHIQLDNGSVQPAANLTDILDPGDDGFTPEYYLVFDPQVQAFQLIVTLPHYSVHTLSVTTLLEIVKPSVVLGVLAGVALLVPTALVLFRRK